MQTTSVADFRENISSMLEQTIDRNEPLSISTDSGSVVILSDEEYRGMIETLRLLSIPGMREKLLAGKAEPISERISEQDYLDKLKRSEEQIERGDVVTLTAEQLKAFEF